MAILSCSCQAPSSPEREERVVVGHVVLDRLVLQLCLDAVLVETLVDERLPGIARGRDRLVGEPFLGAKDHDLTIGIAAQIPAQRREVVAVNGVQVREVLTLGGLAVVEERHLGLPWSLALSDKISRGKGSTPHTERPVETRRSGGPALAGPPLLHRLPLMCGEAGCSAQ